MPVHLLILWPHIHKNVHLAIYPRLLNQQLASVAFPLGFVHCCYPIRAVPATLHIQSSKVASQPQIFTWRS